MLGEVGLLLIHPAQGPLKICTSFGSTGHRVATCGCGSRGGDGTLAFFAEHASVQVGGYTGIPQAGPFQCTGPTTWQWLPATIFPVPARLVRSGGRIDDDTGGDAPSSVGGMSLAAPIVGAAIAPVDASPGMSPSYLNAAQCTGLQASGEAPANGMSEPTARYTTSATPVGSDPPEAVHKASLRCPSLAVPKEMVIGSCSRTEECSPTAMRPSWAPEDHDRMVLHTTARSRATTASPSERDPAPGDPGEAFRAAPHAKLRSASRLDCHRE